MRLAFAVILVAASTGCGRSKQSAPKERAQTSGPIESIVHKTDVSYRLDAVRHRVPLASTPLGRLVGLPVSGDVELDADVTMPLVDNQPAWNRANGTIAVRCLDRCQIGDDVTKLVPPSGSSAASFFGDGIDVGHLDVSGLDLAVEIKDGHARVTRGTVKSPDVILDLALTAELAADLAASSGHACVHYQTTDALKQRAPKTYALLGLIGAMPDAKGVLNITVTTTAGTTKAKPELCDVN